MSYDSRIIRGTNTSSSKASLIDDDGFIKAGKRRKKNKVNNEDRITESGKKNIFVANSSPSSALLKARIDLEPSYLPDTKKVTANIAPSNSQRRTYSDCFSASGIPNDNLNNNKKNYSEDFYSHNNQDIISKKINKASKIYSNKFYSSKNQENPKNNNNNNRYHPSNESNSSKNQEKIKNNNSNNKQPTRDYSSSKNSGKSKSINSTYESRENPNSNSYKQKILLQLSSEEIKIKAEQLLSNQNKDKINKKTSLVLCDQIRDKRTSFEEAITLATQHSVTSFVINAILTKPAPKKSCAWLLKKEIFEQMPVDLKTIYNINAFIKQAAIHKDFEAAKMLFDAAHSANLADNVMYNTYIDAAGKNGQFHEAKRAFDAAVSANLANTVTYSSYIDATGMNGQFDEAKRAFDTAIRANLANTVTYSNYINAAGNNRQFDEAKRVFDAAIRANLADIVMYAGYIDAARKNGQFDEAERAFENAVENKLADKITYMIYLDCLITNDQEKKARELYLELKWDLPIKLQNGMSTIDLHDYSHGAGYLALVQFIEKQPSNQPLCVICGKGCLEDGNYLEFKNYLINKIKKNLREWEFRKDPKNAGVIIVQKRT